MATFSYSSNDADQQDIIEEVEYHADRVTATNQTVGLNYKSIYGNLVKAMRAVANAAPRTHLDKMSFDGSGQGAVNTNNYTVVSLPDDFNRFMEMRLADWNREVYELTDPRSDRVRLMYNTKTAADPQNPVVAKVPDPGGGQDPETSPGEALRCWPQDSAPSIDRFTYVAEFPPEDVPQVLREAIVLKATAYTLAADKEQGWEIMDRAHREILQQLEAGQQPMVQQAIRQAREQLDE